MFADLLLADLEYELNQASWRQYGIGIHPKILRIYGAFIDICGFYQRFIL